MLPPFRVRILRPTPGPGLGRSKDKEFSALVRITAPEYDNTLRVCPEATLKYLDDEDREIVTVGSSFELIQCLESPSQQNPRYTELIPRLSSLPGSRDVSETLATPAVHQRIFHIEPRPTSVQLWREIEERSKGLFKSLHDVQLTPNSIPKPLPIIVETDSSMSDMRLDIDIAPGSGLKVHVGASDDLPRLQELEDYRITSSNASIRPHISHAQGTQSRNSPKSAVDVPYNCSNRIPRLHELAGYGPYPHLRQDPPPTDNPPISNLKPIQKENLLHDRDKPLASQQHLDARTWSRSVGEDPFEFYAALAHAPKTQRREANDTQSLLNLFEAELAKVPSPSAHTQTEALLDRSAKLSGTNLDHSPQTTTQVCIQALDLGLGAALSAFNACLNDIMESVQQASAAVRSADRYRIESAMASFRCFTHEIAASAKVVDQRLKSDTMDPDQGENMTTPNKDNRCAEFLSREVQRQVVNEEPVRMTTMDESKGSSTTEETASVKCVPFSGGSNLTLSPQHDASFSGKAQDGTTVSAEDRKALRPSSNKPNTLPKQDLDDACHRNNPAYSDSYPTTGMPNASESDVGKVYLGEELNKTRASPNATHRLPTSKQFGDEGLAAAHRFPPLPSMEALEPQRPNSQPRVTQRLNTRDDFPYKDKDGDHKTSTPVPLGSTSVTRGESSGEFFNRMTGLGKESIATPHSSLQTSAEQASAGLDDGLAQDLEFLGRHNGNYRQESSGPARYDNSMNNTRRPYSENFSGEGRIGWDTFIRQGSESLITNQGVEHIPSSLNLEPGHVLPSCVPCISSHNVQNDEGASNVCRADINQHSVQSNLGDRDDTAYVSRIQACVTQLHTLGYGSNAAKGGFERLKLYAQVAEGDLSAALDIIDEEQRAYKLGLPG